MEAKLRPKLNRIERAAVLLAYLIILCIAFFDQK